MIKCKQVELSICKTYRVGDLEFLGCIMRCFIAHISMGLEQVSLS